ncbi:flavin reductase [Micromonospora sp. NPDC049081]|uniref:flavin reductase n=1 Tax=Micromonospora sp. NPDC049081 TaxID=3155150 RepID=UPI0033F9D01A
MTNHQPVPPAWTCGGCGTDWPCGPARRQLLAEYRDARVALALYLATQLVTAGRDLAVLPAGRLHHRFLGWTR